MLRPIQLIQLWYWLVTRRRNILFVLIYKGGKEDRKEEKRKSETNGRKEGGRKEEREIRGVRGRS